MMTHVRSFSLRMIAASLALVAIPAFADEAEGRVRLGEQKSEGVVRVSDDPASPTIRAQSPQVVGASHHHEGTVVYEGYCPEAGVGCPLFHGHTCITGHSPLGDWLHMQAMHFRARNQVASAVLRASIAEDCREKHAWMRHKFGYFVPTGCNGKGCPPMGHYSMVYPVDPSYFDQRDGQVYAASGHGGPVSVPLAPVVNHTYNYGWGVPSSRLTPVLHPGNHAPLTVPAHHHYDEAIMR
jgi:hypothetical protein